MEKFIVGLSLLGFLLAMLGCDEQGKTGSLSTSNPCLDVSIITLDVYKSGLDNGLSIIYLESQASLLIKSSCIQLSDFLESPPLPINQVDSGLLNNSFEKIKTEVIILEDSEIKEIEKIVESLTHEDLTSKINEDVRDGGGVKFILVCSGGHVKVFTLMNNATKNQRKFLQYIFSIAVEKSKYNKEQLNIFMR